MASFKDCLVEARTALTSQTTITDVVAEGKITFGARPQEATQPAIVLEAQRSDYDATFDSYAKAITYRVAYLFFSQNAVQLAEMVDTIKDAVQLHTSSNFYIRIEDEGVTSDPDGNNIAYVITTWKDTQGTVANLVGSTGKTIGELAAQDAANTTDQTVEELVNFYLTSTDDTIKYNTAGQPGEGVTHLYGTEWLADGYTGPVLQMFDALSHDGSGTIDGYDTVDVYPNNLHLYTINATSVISTVADGKRWRVMKVYDQVGNNDLVFDAVESFNEDGVWPTVGPILTYYEGAYMISRVEAPHGFLSESGALTNPITVICEVNTVPGRKMTFGAQSVDASGNDRNKPYESWGFANWNGTNYEGAAVNMWHGPAYATDGFTPYAGINDSVNNGQDATRLVETAGGRATYALSRQDAEGRSFDGSNSCASTASTFSAANMIPGQTLKFGFGHANYNTANSLQEGFHSLAIHAGRFVDDTADLKALADSFTKQNGRMSHRDRFTKNQ